MTEVHKCKCGKNKDQALPVKVILDTDVVTSNPAHLPKLATVGSAGHDLISAESLTIQSGETKLIKTSFKWQIPAGYVGMVCSRSGLALKQSLFVLNAPGIVDSDYQGNVGVILHNASGKSQEITIGDRIAQMVIVPVAKTQMILATEFDSETDRGTGGFGSTGV